MEEVEKEKKKGQPVITDKNGYVLGCPLGKKPSIRECQRCIYGQPIGHLGARCFYPHTSPRHDAEVDARRERKCRRARELDRRWV